MASCLKRQVRSMPSASSPPASAGSSHSSACAADAVASRTSFSEYRSLPLSFLSVRRLVATASPRANLARRLPSADFSRRLRMCHRHEVGVRQRTWRGDNRDNGASSMRAVGFSGGREAGVGGAGGAGRRGLWNGC